MHRQSNIQMARKIIVLEVNDDIRRQIIRELKVLGEFKLVCIDLTQNSRGVQLQQNRWLLWVVSIAAIDTNFDLHGILRRRQLGQNDSG